MEARNIYITEFDQKRLLSLINKMGYQADKQYLQKLEQELNRAEVVQPEKIPADVITMNSRVRLHDLENGEDMVYTLVFPDDADMDQGRISVLAPIGTAMIGYRVGDVFEWEVPDGTVKMKVKEILFQPEASGNYDL